MTGKLDRDTRGEMIVQRGGEREKGKWGAMEVGKGKGEWEKVELIQQQNCSERSYEGRVGKDISRIGS